MTYFLTTAALLATIAGSMASPLTQKLIDLKRQNEENTRKIKKLEERLNQSDFKKKSPEPSYIWPAQYMQIPQTNSAVQLIFVPNMTMTYDFNAFAGDFLSPTTLPLAGVDPNASKSGRLNGQARASQLGFRTLSFTNLGEVRSEISLDFYGTASDPAGIPVYQPRLRFAFIEFLGMTIGQTTSNFLDLDAIGETVDYGTILGGSFRHALVQYTINLNKKTSLSLAIERSLTDYTDNTGAITSANSATGLPDLTAKLKYADSFGHIAFRGVLRELKVKNYAGVGAPSLPQVFRKIAWGLGVSAKFFIYKKSNLFAQINFGKGIGRFIILCNGQSAFYNQATGIFDTQNARNGIIGLEHFWTGSLRSNIMYGRTDVTVSPYTPVLTTGTTRVIKSINQVFLNLIYSPIAPLDLGLEYGYADRRTSDFKRGKANRITLGAHYKF